MGPAGLPTSSHPSVDISHPDHLQRRLTRCLERYRAHALVGPTSGAPPAVRAILHSAAGYGTSAFALAVPSEPALDMSDLEWSVAIRLFLSIRSSYPLPIHCLCMRPSGGGQLGGVSPGDLDPFGHHWTTCDGVRGNSYIAGVHDVLVRE